MVHLKKKLRRSPYLPFVRRCLVVRGVSVKQQYVFRNLLEEYLYGTKRASAKKKKKYHKIVP